MGCSQNMKGKGGQVDTDTYPTHEKLPSKSSALLGLSIGWRQFFLMFLSQ